jgi:2-haloacid dehalogenase
MTIHAVTFDIYSALYDTPAGLASALASLFRHRGLPHDPLPVARAWREAHREYLLLVNSLDRERASNRRAIEVTARYVLRSLQPPPTPEEERALVRAWEQLPPWPEAASVLSQVRRCPLTVAALSNGDRDMLKTLVSVLPVRFDQIISTEGGKFKPHPSVYLKALETLGVRAEDLLHVAGSSTDAVGATAAGIRTVWVNRAEGAVLDARFAPAHEMRDLRGVLSLLSSGSSCP